MTTAITWDCPQCGVRSALLASTNCPNCGRDKTQDQNRAGLAAGVLGVKVQDLSVVRLAFPPALAFAGGIMSCLVGIPSGEDKAGVPALVYLGTFLLLGALPVLFVRTMWKAFKSGKAEAAAAAAAGAAAAAALAASVKKCPFCAEEIKAEASVCKHCGRDQPQPLAEPAQQARSSGASPGN